MLVVPIVIAYHVLKVTLTISILPVANLLFLGTIISWIAFHFEFLRFE